MSNFAFVLNGFAALVLILGLVYLVVFLPMQLITKALAHAKAKTDKLRQLRASTVVAEYAAPQGLKPAELGELYDAKLTIQEVFATVMSLEQQGLIVLERSTAGFTIVSTQPATTELEPYETYLLEGLAAVSGQTITKHMLGGFSARFGLLVTESVTAKGYRISIGKALKGFLMRVLVTGLGLMLLTAIAFHPSTASGAGALVFFLVFFTPGYLFFAAILYYTFQKISGQPWTATAKLKQLWPEIEGYRQYIQEVELDTLQFENEDVKQQAKNGTLPYAIALGLNTGWRDQLK